MNHPRSHALVRGLLAGGALLLLLAALPVALTLGVGWPLPAHLPTAAGVQHALTRPISDGTVLKTVAVLTWLAWLRLLLAVLDEFRTQLTGYPSRRHLLVGAFNQALAHRLVAATLIALPNLTAVAHATPIDALTRASTSVSSSTLTPEQTRDSDLPAAAPLASPQPHAAPQRAAELVAGKAYVVESHHGRHYDSLWDIAARHLGDGRRYCEIYELNRGRPQPDGGELTRASLIQPGWLLLLPADAVGTDLHPVHDLEADFPTGAASTTTHPHSAAPHRVTGKPATARRSRRPNTPAEPSANSAGSRREAARPPLQAGKTEEHSSIAIDLGLGIGALGVLTALMRARRVAQRRRRIGYRPAPPPTDTKAAETALHRQAQSAATIAQRVRNTAALATRVAPDSHVRAALATPGGTVELIVDTSLSEAPPPFSARDGRWVLAVSDMAYTFGLDDDVDPRPLLASVGTCADAQLFIDLEHAGLTALVGEQKNVENLLVHLVTGLASAPWSELVEVLVPATLAARVGPLDRVVGLLSLDERAAELLRYAQAVRVDVQHETLAASRTQDTTDGVLLRLLVGWSNDELPDAIANAACDVRSPLVALVVGDDPRAVATWEVNDDGVVLPTVQLEARPPVRTESADALSDLVSWTSTSTDVPVDDPHYVEVREDSPPEGQPTGVEVGILGPVELHGIDQPRRTPVLHILVYLALHRRGVTAEQLSTALSPDAALSANTLRNRIAEARAAVGGAISKAPRWRLSDDVTCDWQRFQSLAAGGPGEQRQALELVRGRPFDGFLDAEWTHTEGIRTEIESAIVDLAVQFGERALADGDAQAAEFAAAAGLKASPYDERLYRIGMRAAGSRGATGKVDSLMAQLNKVMGADVEPDDAITSETLDLYADIRAQARVGIASND